ncbi:hypothetical protein EXIGLDRAFT_442088 [Exidia glandulosa HHB12029]|uniref:Uncharacterized protein n=1 Tax=Exidia glandulosa HHB12029 TaxID=1314781 RepID=A0A165KBJ2_EXIGL|nr:hypothetical protein EXIGLDRAFT_442088 [Exidia glandulosa HHB12029]
MREVTCGLSTGPVRHRGTGDGDIGFGAKRDATSTRAFMWVHVSYQRKHFQLPVSNACRRTFDAAVYG